MKLLSQLPDRPFAGGHESERDHAVATDAACALLGTVDAVLRAASDDGAFRVAAGAFAENFPCEFVGLAWRSNERFQLKSFTHIANFDRASELAREWEQACEEYHAAFGSESMVQVLEVRAGEPVVFVPLTGVAQVVIGYGLLKIRHATKQAEQAETLLTFGEHLGTALEIKLGALRQSRIARSWEKLRRSYSQHKRVFRGVIAAACVVALLPLPYQVRCEAELQPVVRRHMAAPFDGILQRCLVKPGDVVRQGQSLGRLDPKDLTWEIAGAIAERDRAAKSRDVNMAAGKTAAAQIDRLEAKRHEERIKLLENRLAHLDVAAPIAGVVVAGNLERVEGAPVKVGQSLFEVAPLEQMVVEVFVPEADIERVRSGQEIQLYLDSEPGDDLTGTVSRIYPRAEIRNGANVFVAEVPLDNQSGRLRPGMKASVDISTERRPLGWIAVESIRDFVWRKLR